MFFQVAFKKTSSRSLSVGRVCSSGVADAFSAILDCWKLHHFLPNYLKPEIPKGMAGEVHDWLQAQSSGRTLLVLWDNYPETPHIIGAWKGLIGVDYFAELVKLSDDHSKDREPARKYDSILVTKPKISASQRSLKKVINSKRQERSSCIRK